MTIMSEVSSLPGLHAAPAAVAVDTAVSMATVVVANPPGDAGVEAVRHRHPGRTKR